MDPAPEATNLNTNIPLNPQDPLLGIDEDGQRKPMQEGPIMNVWIENLEEEMAAMAEVLEDFPLIAMDTEYPGICIR